MSDIFSDLSSMGLTGLSGVKIFEDEDEKKKSAKKEIEAVAVQLNEADFLFDKKVQCPVCDKEFKTKTVKTGKPRLIGSDPDLRPKYQGIDSVKYDVIVCPHCGYGALSRFFSYMTTHQAKLIHENVTANFKGLTETGETYTYDEAIARYKLALLNTIVKKAKISERAYTCLKIAWLYRGKGEQLTGSEPDYKQQKETCVKAEQEMLTNAYEGFVMCISKELFPICGMDETTLDYLMANLAKQIGRNDEALRLVSKILTTPSANTKIKDRARDLKDSIKK
ncbi:MAG: DUF2225 domain-containing protein [Lachnospiraceae bacterium]